MQKRRRPGFAGVAVLGAALAAAAAGAGAVVQTQAPAPGPAAPTFSRDVAPILHAHCVTCHRPGEAAPMSLLTYADARPWARAIAREVAGGVMPPWHAEAPEGTFENERRLSAAEKDVVARWVAAGAPQGDPAALPAPPAFTDGWRIGEPDAVFEMAEAYEVPATGTVEYEYFYIPTNFTGTRWLQAIEVRPGSRAVVHHALVYYQAPAEGRSLPIVRPNPQHNRLPPRTAPGRRPRRRPVGPSQLIATYAPGTDPQVFRAGTALRLPPGGVLELQLHYTANGTPATDRTRVGMVFAKEPPAHGIRATQFFNTQFTIPAGARDHRVDTDLRFVQDAMLWGLFPHTHVRGVRWLYTLTLPDGTSRTLLSVPRYDFNWQTYYMFKAPLRVPAGARIQSSAWYDNSAANRANPDPTAEVAWGDQTWEEMQYTGVLYSIAD
jgi:hypothetical protein